MRRSETVIALSRNRLCFTRSGPKNIAAAQRAADFAVFPYFQIHIMHDVHVWEQLWHDLSVEMHLQSHTCAPRLQHATSYVYLDAPRSTTKIFAFMLHACNLLSGVNALQLRMWSDIVTHSPIELTSLR